MRSRARIASSAARPSLRHDEARQIGVLDAVAQVLEAQRRDGLVGAPERRIEQHVLAVLSEAPVRVDVPVAHHAVGIQRPVQAFERVPETEHARVGRRLRGRVARGTEARLGVVGEAPDRGSPPARRADGALQLALRRDVRLLLDGRGEGAVVAAREHGPDVHVVAALIVPQVAVVLSVRTDREAARALPPRNRHAARRDAPRRRTGREIGHSGRVRSAGLRRGELAAVDRTGLVPAPHERAIEPAVLAPERQHAIRQVGGPGRRGAGCLARARRSRSLRAERQPHRAERIPALGGHARRRGLRPPGTLGIAVGPRRPGAPIARGSGGSRRERRRGDP